MLRVYKGLNFVIEIQKIIPFTKRQEHTGADPGFF